MPTLRFRLNSAAPLLSLALALFVATTSFAKEGHPAKAEHPDRCEPLRAREWQELCDNDAGREQVRKLLGSCRRWHSFGDLDGLERASAILHVGDSAGSCARARRQLLAVALNLASGRLSNACCVEVGGKQVELRSAMVRHDDDCHAGRDCDRARDILAAFNEPSRVHHCGACDGAHHHEGCGHPQGEGHDDDDDGDDHHGKGKGKGNGKGHP